MLADQKFIRIEARALESMRSQIDALIAEIKELRQAFRPDLSFPEEWNLPPQMSRVLSALYAAKGKPLTKRAIEIAMGGTRTAYTPNGNAYTVLIKALRHRIAPLGIEVRNKFNQGYYLPPESIEIIRAALQGEKS